MFFSVKAINVYLRNLYEVRLESIRNCFTRKVTTMQCLGSWLTSGLVVPPNTHVTLCTDLLHRFSFRQGVRRLSRNKATNTGYLALYLVPPIPSKQSWPFRIQQNPTNRAKIAPFQKSNRCRRSLYIHICICTPPFQRTQVDGPAA